VRAGPWHAGSEGVAVDRELARNVNLQIHRVARLWGDPVAYRCECGSPACESQVEVDAVAFAEALRADGVYLVLAGHERPDAEPVSRGVGYRLVRVTRDE